ncbi:MAG TPA: ATP-dependent zinc metalloprotease FtsH [Candidatus Krumholzibacteria bacterium]|nr:ATP-dependent zinc metalloprotease FtsH [Candidatus Krumholzibacteria bacterium]HPD70903.1 ATP-dependent zinc metalloprotease FtsH [Candidatus Krumholzibacteria bacterium]HRY39397.1 ATP-dependent zinc metalloprotease FtsH [Candidatus Krumholzibacteria bacterium]
MSNKPQRNPIRPPQGPGTPRPGFTGRGVAFWLLLLLLLLVVFRWYSGEHTATSTISFSAFAEQVEKGNLQELTIVGPNGIGRLAEQAPITLLDGSIRPVKDFKVGLMQKENFYDWLKEHNPEVRVVVEEARDPWLTQFLTVYMLPILLLIAVWIFFFRQMQSGSNRAFSFGKSKAKLVNMDRPEVTFEDVAGCDEAKVELQEVIEFLRSPKKFQRLGGRIPKGALLVGPPGTGKTLLGRAVAGEAGVPFFSMSGSDFVEMFVGVGASRVRDLFEQGKKNAPCIIFIDEIDAVGRHRGAGLGGGHDEREQTLNQLLVEMDGFESNEGVILLAATNRPDVLDPALLRPGRFDRQIVVDLPDLGGREAILKVHMKKVRHAASVSAKVLAAGTPGLAGADLENLVNEAALLAARRNHEEVVMEDFVEAREKVMMGPERRSRVLTEEVKKIVAYHESGHAIVAEHLEHADPAQKVTIIPRGQALGVTFTPPAEDVFLHSNEKLLAQICKGLGGRAAEALFLGGITDGAGNDIRQVTGIARYMVTRAGMSATLGPVAYEEATEQVFLGRDYSRRQTHSERTLHEIDTEVHRIIDEQYARARNLLEQHRDEVETMAAALLERETLDRAEVEMIIRGERLPERTILSNAPSVTQEHPADLPLDLAELAETVRKQREAEKAAERDGTSGEAAPVDTGAESDVDVDDRPGR